MEDDKKKKKINAIYTVSQTEQARKQQTLTC